MKKAIFILLLLLLPALIVAQKDSTNTKLLFASDFRFRIEQDWNSLKSYGTYRDNRTRLRYRARFGVSYDYKDWISFGFRLRTGDPKKQQDPQLTLGDGFKEFGTLPIAFEKIYANFRYKWLSAWIGKNTFPFEKQNELFWSDNVFPEGISLGGKFTFKNKYLQSLQINTGHFILAANGTSFDSDSYFQGVQFVTTHWTDRLNFFPTFYYFNKIPNIPDGNETFRMNYAIMHIGTKIEVFKSRNITVGFDYYQNIKDYNSTYSIPQKFRNQKQGFITSASLGKLEQKGDVKLQFTYSYLERFAAVDFLAQNDWARWDYSSQGSPDGRLTNFKGFELMVAYALDKNINLKIKGFHVDQIKPFEVAKETGNRVRLDFNIRF
ncbi:MAG: putative porin [Maribacter sp.]|nr:putative porin [Maribacter sp.]